MTTAADLGQVLPGTWHILATTFPLWLTGKRLKPTITYTPLAGDPLVLLDDVSYRTRTGATRHLIGTDRYQPRAGRFVWRGRGLLGLLTAQWSVDHVNAGGDIAVLSFDRSLVTPAGMDVIGRGPCDRPDMRYQLSPVALGLTTDQFSALTWL